MLHLGHLTCWVKPIKFVHIYFRKEVSHSVFIKQCFVATSPIFKCFILGWHDWVNLLLDPLRENFHKLINSEFEFIHLIRDGVLESPQFRPRNSQTIFPRSLSHCASMRPWLPSRIFGSTKNVPRNLYQCSHFLARSILR